MAPIAGLATGSPGLMVGNSMVGLRASIGLVTSVGCGATDTPGAGSIGGGTSTGASKVGSGLGASEGSGVGAAVGSLVGAAVGCGVG